MPDRQEHWERVYDTRASHEMSWFQREPAMSLRMLETAGLAPPPESSTSEAGIPASWTRCCSVV